MKIVVFDLHSGIWPHSMLLNKFISQLDPDEAEIIYLTCGSLFQDFCAVSESRKRDFTKRGVERRFDCIDCVFTAQFSNGSLQGKSLSKNPLYKLSDFYEIEFDALENEIYQQILNQEFNVDYELANLPIVKFALYETLIKFKKLDLNLTSDEMLYLQFQLKNIIRVYLTGIKFLDNCSNIDVIVCHSPEYGVNNTFVSLAAQRGIPVYSFRGSPNLGEMNSSATLWRWDINPSASHARDYWIESTNIMASEVEMKRIENHKKQLLNARSPFVYSAKSTNSRSENEVYTILGIRNKKPTVLLALSSTDEIIANSFIGRGSGARYPGTVFKDQFEWVSHTISWASKRPEFNLVIRLHPRDLPNKRDSVISSQYKRWMELFGNLPDNVYLNHPEQSLSFSEVCNIAKCFTTGWSSTAIEALSLGKPVVTYDTRLPAYPANIHLTGESIEQYIQNLELAMIDTDNEKHQKNVDAWLVHSLLRSSFELSGRLFENLRLIGPSWISKIFNAFERYLFFVWRPIELWMTKNTSPDREKIRQMLLNRYLNVYVTRKK